MEFHFPLIIFILKISMRQNRNVPVSVPQEAQTDIKYIHLYIVLFINQLPLLFSNMKDLL
jgi:hypothetical protein